MKVALPSKNKLQFVDRRIKTPSKTKSVQNGWERCNTMVLYWMLNSISSSIARSIMWIDVAADAWNDLELCFPQSDSLRVTELQYDI